MAKLALERGTDVLLLETGDALLLETLDEDLISSDTGSGADSVLGRLIALADAGSGVETAILALASSDSGLGIEHFKRTKLGEIAELLASLTKADLGTGVESLGTFERLLADSGIGADALISLAVALSKTDTGTGTEAILSRVLALLESGIASDISSLIVALLKSDIGTGIDAVRDKLMALADLGIAVDAVYGVDTMRKLRLVLSTSQYRRIEEKVNQYRRLETKLAQKRNIKVETTE